MIEHSDRADELEGEAADMQRASENLEREIGETRADWRRKQADPAVPGADPPEDQPPG